MKKIELEIVALSHTVNKNSSYAVVLGETRGTRRMPIVIGTFEAQAISIVLDKIQPTRPLTHDLFHKVMLSFEIELLEVLIYKLEENIFYSKLICLRNHEQIVEIDSRTSDALALAIRANCSIYTFESVLDEANNLLKGNVTTSKNPLSALELDNENQRQTSQYSNKTLDELNNLLDKAIEQEDYISAIKIRDEINKRNSNS